MAKAIKMVTNNIPLEKIPFNHDPLTLILKDALSGKLDDDGEPSSVTRMFVNISPSKFDTAVTNRSLKFAMQTGKLKTKLVDQVY